ncbi:hypothetical protein F5Y18DRAFT_424572 [Xylariaceae sp. FL1019]|nr:hypothetical protein F5Y18DRAFT_424572 [Xylariaceae sp. FL1019]
MQSLNVATFVSLLGLTMAQEYQISLIESPTACSGDSYGKYFLYASDSAGSTSSCQTLGSYPLAGGVEYCSYYDTDSDEQPCDGKAGFGASSVNVFGAACNLFTEPGCSGTAVNVFEGCSAPGGTYQSFICSWGA